MARPVRRWARAGLAVVATAGVVAGLVAVGTAPAGATDQRYPLRNVTSISVVGHGYGHGRGMSQWGAYGAAVDGLTYAQILAFYYPGTTLSTVTDPTMRVLISADNDNNTHVLQASGLSVCYNGSVRQTLSSSSAITSWRIVRIGSVLRLQSYSSAGYHTYAINLGTTATFTLSPTCASYGAAPITLALPNGSTEGIRAGVRAVIYGTGVRTVGVMTTTSYLASVVPSEMPASWATEALRAQAVAARSYSERYRQLMGGSSQAWDICDTTSCQVFHGTSAESSASTAAVAATARRVLTYQGALAFTEFSCSNGGWTTAGSSSTPYLVAKADPYDGRVASSSNPHTWADSVSPATLEQDYPAIGTFVRLDVQSRDGHGDFGGRIQSVTIQGTAGHVTVGGSTFAGVAGFKSVWWSVRYAGPNTDLTNDGRGDLVVRDTTTGALRVNPSTGTGLLAGSSQGSGWQQFDQVLNAGDLTGDFTPDLVAREHTTGALMLYPGDGAGWVNSGRTLLAGPTAYGVLAAPGDFSGDGHADLMGVSKTTGQLMLLRGNGAGGLAAPVAIGSGWQIMNAILGLGDVNGDGYADLLGRVASTGELRLYYGNGRGGFLSQVTLPGTYGSLTAIAAPGDLSGDGRTDLVGIDQATGHLLRYAGTSSGFGAATVLNSSLDWRTFDLMG